jgi:hypothetical protein
VVTKTDMRWLTTELGTKALTERVAALCCGLDHTLWDSSLVSESAKKCQAVLGAAPRVEQVSDRLETVLPFDLARAHELYEALLGPAEDLIRGKRLLVVPSGPLTSLPFNVLVTEPPKGATPEKLAGYREAAWLGARTAITVLPSVASLKALRQFAKASLATRPYLGVGNPLLDGPQDHPQWGAHYRKQAQLARDKQKCPKPPTRPCLPSLHPVGAVVCDPGGPQVGTQCGNCCDRAQDTRGNEPKVPEARVECEGLQARVKGCRSGRLRRSLGPQDLQLTSCPSARLYRSCH